MLGSAGFLFAVKGIWVKVFYPVLALLVPLGLTVALRLTASERETRDVAAEKLESQKLLGLSFQEKGMLDMALATFNKLPFTQDMKLVYVNLGLDYENRGHRDKAFLVYKKVFDIDPTFEDVAHRMERLSQAGAGSSLFAATARPTVAPIQTPPTSGSPLSGLVSTPIPSDEAPTELSPTFVPEIPAQRAAGFGADGLPSARSTPAPTRRPPPTGLATPSPGVTAVPAGPVPQGARFGRYEVEQHLGRGGMGDVYLVHDTTIKRRAALKTMRLDADSGDAKQTIELRQRFYREGQRAGQLTHPNIVTVYDMGEDLGMSYIVMEFVDGHTLTQLMKKQRFSVPQIKHVIYNAGMGLDYAHENGIFHRDVKPDNIMVGKTGIVKVMDFGIAHVVNENLTRTGSVLGTPAYMSPEQVGGKKVDGRSDIFSLGVILYELLTGTKPFPGDTIPTVMLAILQTDPAHPSTVDAKIHPAWDEILRKALAKNREERYATVREFAQAVRDAPAG
jgi:predicted Ser/Thr protein kinase